MNSDVEITTALMLPRPALGVRTDSRVVLEVTISRFGPKGICMTKITDGHGGQSTMVGRALRWSVAPPLVSPNWKREMGNETMSEKRGYNPTSFHPLSGDICGLGLVCTLGQWRFGRRKPKWMSSADLKADR